jgi:GT2 family glycosyltransferase
MIPDEILDMAKKAKVDVIIPHYGPDDDLNECLETLKADPCLGHLDIRDNNKENLGFTKAVNDGIRDFLKRGTSEFVAIVNNDTTILEGGFAPLVARLISNPKAGIVAPMSVIHDSPDQIQHAGGEQAFPNGMHRSGLRSLGQCAEPASCKWLSFVVVLIRRDALVDTGLLDEKMWLIGSDSDFCYRLRYAGWECWYEPTSIFTHKCGESSGATSTASATIQKKDMFYWYRKWVKGGGMFTELANAVT